MFFIASKVFWALVQPLSLVFLLGLFSWILGLLNRRRLALTFGALALLFFGLSAFTTLGFNLIAPLENRFEQPAKPPENVTAIIMLGGATAGRVSTARQIAELTEAGDRLAETVRLAGVYPNAKIIVSGGVGLLIADGEPEAHTALRFFTDQGIARERIVLEAESRNTDENAAFTASLIRDNEGQALLVTSAFHMPRSIGLFRNVGVQAIPWPVDYRSAGTEGFGLDIANPVLNISTTGVAIREWLGLLAYSWTGRTEDVFPSPTD
jgi:uncharacterized SAM-binding protein YcdF (DUF218 family)